MVQGKRQAGAIAKPLKLGPRAAEFVAIGQRKVFPEDAINELALDLGRSGDCYIPVTEVEAAVVSFVRALGKSGWTVFPPGNALQD